MKYELVPGMWCSECCFGENHSGIIVCVKHNKECIPGETVYKEVPSTNADRIRTMSNEELAELLYEVSDTVGCPGRPGHWKEWKCPIEGTKKQCDGFKCWLDWLNAESKEEE